MVLRGLVLIVAVVFLLPGKVWAQGKVPPIAVHTGIGQAFPGAKGYTPYLEVQVLSSEEQSLLVFSAFVTASVDNFSGDIGYDPCCIYEIELVAFELNRRSIGAGVRWETYGGRPFGVSVGLGRHFLDEVQTVEFRSPFSGGAVDTGTVPSQVWYTLAELGIHGKVRFLKSLYATGGVRRGFFLGQENGFIGDDRRNVFTLGVQYRR